MRPPPSGTDRADYRARVVPRPLCFEFAFTPAPHAGVQVLPQHVWTQVCPASQSLWPFGQSLN